MGRVSNEVEIRNIQLLSQLDAYEVASYASKLRRGISPVCVANLMGIKSQSTLETFMRKWGYRLNGHPINTKMDKFAQLDYDRKYKDKSEREFTAEEYDYIYDGIKQGRSLANLLTDLDLPVRKCELEQAKLIKARIDEENSKIIPISRGGLMKMEG